MVKEYFIYKNIEYWIDVDLGENKVMEQSYTQYLIEQAKSIIDSYNKFTIPNKIITQIKNYESYNT